MRGIGTRLGFVGFGEVAYHYCRGVVEAGASRADVIGFYHRVGQGTDSEKRAAALGVRLTGDPEEFAQGCDLVLSVAVPHGAETAAQRVIPHLTRQLFADLNSTSPAVKRSLSELATAHGIAFVDAAILGSVVRWKQRVPMVASGRSAEAFAATLEPFGTHIRVLGSEIGAAARFKMIRSAYTKGAALLMVETLMAADRAGLLDAMVDEFSMIESASALPQRLEGEIKGTIKHAARQAKEIEYVIETYQEIGLTSRILPGVVRLLQDIALTSQPDAGRPWQDDVHHLNAVQIGGRNPSTADRT